MNANANIVNLKKGPSNLVRPRFSPGLLLRDDDLRTGVDYTRDLSRLLFSSLFGCGVVCGLKVTVQYECEKLVVTVGSGVALNGNGDPIHVPTETQLTLDPSCGEKIPSEMWILLCRMEKCCAPRSAVCGCEEEDSASVCTREQEMFEIRIVKAEPDECSCMCSPMTPLPDAATLKQRQDSAAAKAQVSGTNVTTPDCACANPCDECYKEHYAGTCECGCCDSECVVLAYINVPEVASANSKTKTQDIANARVNHSVRRFVRPVLMRDPEVWKEQNGPELCPLTDQKTGSPKKKPGK